MTIHIEALSFDVIIGLLDFERERTQRVLLDVEIVYPYHHDTFIDYADVVMLIKNHLRDKRYKLLEDALLGLKESIQKEYPCIERLFIKLLKPDILTDCSVGLSETWNF